MRYWLMKSEPDAFSIDDLKKSGTQAWDGVRNYQARNFMRDQMQVGDLAFFYHSNCTPPGIVGIMQVCKSAYPDFTAFDPDSKYYDSKSTTETPRWFMVEVAFKRKFQQMITLETLKAEAALASMQLLRKGNRLSILPLTNEEWDTILTMA